MLANVLMTNQGVGQIGRQIRQYAAAGDRCDSIFGFVPDEAFLYLRPFDF
jgi:hypothetical protein